jgi:hypothetical protein
MRTVIGHTSSLANWGFNLYEGDKLYLQDGRAIIISKAAVGDAEP